jgi:hypothetical protein
VSAATTETTPAQALALVALLEKQLKIRRPDAEAASNYYRGNQPLSFASTEFRDYFGTRYKDFADNWCAPIAEAPTERLVAEGIRVSQSAKPTTDDDLWRVWRANEADVESGLAFLSAINTRRAFGLVWGNSDDESTPDVTFEDSRQAIVAYEAGSRRKRRAGLKLWFDDDAELEYATLYTPDAVWKYQRTTRDYTRAGIILPLNFPTGAQWEQRENTGDDVWPLPNPMGVVPLVELPNRPLLGEEPISDIAGAMAMQDAINLLWSQLFTTADFAAFPQRIMFGAEMPTVPVLDANGQVVGKKPIDLAKLRQDRILWVPDPAAKSGEWSSADLAVFTAVIELAVGHLAAQTRTPPHYLVTKQGMSNLSGDALRAAETGLVKKVQEKQLYLGGGLREMFALIALAQGGEANTRKAADIRSTGTVVWRDAEMRSEAQLVDSLTKLDAIGFPFQYLAERYGLTDTEIQRVVGLKRAEQADALFGSPLMSEPGSNGADPNAGQAAGTPPKPTGGIIDKPLPVRV